MKKKMVMAMAMVIMTSLMLSACSTEDANSTTGNSQEISENEVLESEEQSKEQSETENNAKESDEITSTPEIDDDSLIKSNVGETIIDNDYVEVVFNGTKEDGGCRVYLTITNKLDEIVTLETNRYFSVNGLSIHPGFYEKMEPKATEEYSIGIGGSSLTLSYIDKVTNIDGLLMIRPENFEKVYEEFTLIPEGVTEFDDTQYMAEETDQILIDNEDYLFVIKGEPIYSKELALEYYFQNNTDKDITIHVRGELDIDTEPGLKNTKDTAVALSGNGVYDEIIWWGLEEYTGTIPSVELTITMKEEGGIEELFTHTVTIDFPYEYIPE